MEESNRNSFDKFLAPDKAERAKRREMIRNTAYYGCIILLSLLSTLVIPFFAGGISGDFSANFPTDEIGWIIYWIIRIGIALLNLGMFILFKLQAKVNVKDDPNYIKAKEILHGVAVKSEATPMSPKAMEFKEWTTKGITITFTSLIMGCTLSSLMLSFDAVTFWSCLSTVIVGAVFGYVTMRRNEIYWTEEYLEYAEYRQRQLNKQKEIQYGNQH